MRVYACWPVAAVVLVEVLHDVKHPGNLQYIIGSLHVRMHE